MSNIPEEELQRIAKLSGYDRTLELDIASRIYGLTVEQIEAILPVLQGENSYGTRSEQQPTNQEDSFPVSTSKANQINSTGMRFNYDPSAQAQENRKKISQAIICPTCNAGLGIPSIRPIKVTCPSCGNESIFRD